MDYTWALNQTAVYWAKGAPDGYGGHSWASPVEVACRWVDQNVKYTDPAGEEKVSKARVLVNQVMYVGDVLYLGTLVDLPTPTSTPDAVSGSHEIKQFQNIPDLTASSFVRRAVL